MNLQKRFFICSCSNNFTHCNYIATLSPLEAHFPYLLHKTQGFAELSFALLLQGSGTTFNLSRWLLVLPLLCPENLSFCALGPCSFKCVSLPLPSCSFQILPKNYFHPPKFVISIALLVTFYY